MYAILNKNHVVIARDFKTYKEAKSYANLHWYNTIIKKQ